MSYSFEAKLPVKNLTFAILKNQRNLLFACEKKSFVFDYVSKEILQKFQTHSKPITSLFSLQKSQLFLTYTDEAFISIFKINKKVPLLQLKGNANSFLKDLTVSKIKKNHYLISAQYTELIKFWVIELTMKFTQPKILDSYTVKAQKNENISNSFMKNSQELIFCIGHHSDLKFCVLHDIIEKETEEKSCGINKLALEEEIRKLDWIGTGLVRKETKNKTKTQSHQVYFHQNLF